MLRILFMGTPDFATVCLSKLVETNQNIVGVVTQPDKAMGRGMKTGFSDVKKYALQQNLPIFQPTTLKDGAFQDQLEELNPDIIVVVAYGKILPEYVLSYPKYGCVNVHGSLLPKYRGASPIQRAVMNGEKVTGVTTMLMDKGMDTGDMISKRSVSIEENDNLVLVDYKSDKRIEAEKHQLQLNAYRTTLAKMLDISEKNIKCYI